MAVMAKTNKANKKFISKVHKSETYSKNSGKKEFKAPDKRGRLIVRNLPFQTNEEELQKHFETFGNIRKIQLLRRPNKKLVGCGFVEFSSRLHAEKAVEELNGKPFLGRPIYVEKAVSRDRYAEPTSEAVARDENKDKEVKKVAIKKQEPTHDDEDNYDDDESDSDDTDNDGEDKDDVVFNAPEIKKEELSSDEESNSETDSQSGHQQNTNTNLQKNKNLRKGRLIIRNLSFKSTEEKVKSHFAPFGEITEVKLLRKPDKTLVGCGFVQFSKKLSAAKAIHHTSGKPFLGRPIIVDWALAKDKFKKMQEDAIKKEIKKEDTSDNESKPIDVSNVSIKNEKSEESDDSTDSDKDEDSEDEKSDNDDDDDSENDDDSEMDESHEDEEGDETRIKQEFGTSKKQKIDDIEERKTVFVKNLPFTVDNSSFKKCMEQFGPVYYALVCTDKFTEHSKGSGFVKFKNKEDADKCLSAGTELTLKGNVLDPHPALKRDDLQRLKDKGKKDNRNMYLVREGLIIAGTPAARGVSVVDMERRLQLEQWKNNKLRNLNMFVSRNRLVIHNLPENYSDKQLRKLFQKFSDPSSTITEARVMRDLKHVDNKGMSLSKGYGFVSFEKHEDALKALRSINNNPTVFSKSSRPIVAFSIENRSVINTKRKRMVRSQQKNPLCKNFKHDEGEPDIKKARLSNISKEGNENEPDYVGIASKPGATIKIRQKYKLKNQAQQHVQDIRKEKREMKMSRKIRRTEHIKQKQVEKKTRKRTTNAVNNDTAFTNLIDKYKTKLMSQETKKKWYD